MRKNLLYVVLVSIMILTTCITTIAGGVYNTKMQAVIYNDLDAFISTANQTNFGQDATIRAMTQDIRDGNAIMIPKGTRVSVVECYNYMCVIAVEGHTGFWFISQYSIK